MRKFLILLKKEIKELLTLEVILPLIITAGLFMFIGNLVGKEQDKTKQPAKSYIVDQDKTEFTTNLVTSFKQAGIDPTVVDLEKDAAIKKAKDDKVTTVLLIPAGFTSKIGTATPEKISTFTIIKNFSLMGSGSTQYASIVAAITAANQIVSDQLIVGKTGQDITLLKNPIRTSENIIVGSKESNISPNAVMGFVTQQTMFIPIILFFVIVFASQMIATAIANEKENKTLETLLTTPVSRNAIVVAKMAAAGIVALLGSVIYMFGFKSYIGGLGGNTQAGSEIKAAMEQLGLVLKPEHYLLLGISLFVGILLALAISLILGAFAQDVKSVAGLTTPIMVLVMIPYFLTMFMDINTLSPGLKYLAYAIPFSHVFMTAPNLFMQNYSAVGLGILYQLAWVVVAVLVAAKIFSSDKIMTMKLNFSKKRR